MMKFDRRQLLTGFIMAALLPGKSFAYFPHAEALIVPPGFALLVDDNGAYLTDDNGNAYSVIVFLLLV